MLLCPLNNPQNGIPPFGCLICFPADTETHRGPGQVNNYSRREQRHRFKLIDQRKYRWNAVPGIVTGWWIGQSQFCRGAERRLEREMGPWANPGQICSWLPCQALQRPFTPC